MLMSKKGETFAEGGKTFTVGEMVWANDASDYCGLLGYVAEIRSGGDKETDNEGTEIVCNFMVPVKEHMV